MRPANSRTSSAVFPEMFSFFMASTTALSFCGDPAAARCESSPSVERGVNMALTLHLRRVDCWPLALLPSLETEAVSRLGFGLGGGSSATVSSASPSYSSSFSSAGIAATEGPGRQGRSCVGAHAQQRGWKEKNERVDAAAVLAFISRSCIFRPPTPASTGSSLLEGNACMPTLAHRERHRSVSHERCMWEHTKTHREYLLDAGRPRGRRPRTSAQSQRCRARTHAPKEAARAAAKEARSIAVVRGRSERFFARRADCICARQAGGEAARQQSCSSKGHSQTRRRPPPTMRLRSRAVATHPRAKGSAKDLRPRRQRFKRKCPVHQSQDQ